MLQVQHLGGDRWTAPHPDEDPEQRDVLFGGQLVGQMIMVASAGGAGAKEVKSIHAVSARAGAYSAGAVEYEREQMHDGRAWASSTITASQGDRLLSRSLVLLNHVEPDLIRHAVVMPDVPDPEDCPPQPITIVFPGTEARPVDRPDARTANSGAPMRCDWIRPPTFDDVRGQPGSGRVELARVHDRHRHARHIPTPSESVTRTGPSPRESSPTPCTSTTTSARVPGCSS